MSSEWSGSQWLIQLFMTSSSSWPAPQLTSCPRTKIPTWNKTCEPTVRSINYDLRNIARNILLKRDQMRPFYFLGKVVRGEGEWGLQGRKVWTISTRLLTFGQTSTEKELSWKGWGDGVVICRGMCGCVDVGQGWWWWGRCGPIGPNPLDLERQLRTNNLETGLMMTMTMILAMIKVWPPLSNNKKRPARKRLKNDLIKKIWVLF